jgi:hypothetical protein
MHKHTPSPWVYDAKECVIIAPSVIPSWWEPIEGEEYTPRTVVVYLRGSMGGHDPKADAYLIAAAPELAEALRDLVEYAASCAALLDERPVSLQRAREVLAKAIGEAR